MSDTADFTMEVVNLKVIGREHVFRRGLNVPQYGKVAQKRSTINPTSKSPGDVKRKDVAK